MFKANFGFTLLETVIAVAVAMMTGTFLLTILVGNSGVFYKENAVVNEGLDLNDALMQVNNQIKQAAFVATGYPESEPTYVSDSDTLVLKLPALSASGVLPDTYDYAVIRKDFAKPTILRLQVFPDPTSTRPPVDIVLTTLLQTLQFSYLDQSGSTVAPQQATSVGIALTVLAKTGSIGSGRSATVVTNLRNAGS